MKELTANFVLNTSDNSRIAEILLGAGVLNPPAVTICPST
jgi:hypothetical protein